MFCAALLGGCAGQEAGGLLTRMLSPAYSTQELAACPTLRILRQSSSLLPSLLSTGRSTRTGCFIPPNHNPEGKDSYQLYSMAEETEAVQSKVHSAVRERQADLPQDCRLQNPYSPYSPSPETKLNYSADNTEILTVRTRDWLVGLRVRPPDIASHLPSFWPSPVKALKAPLGFTKSSSRWSSMSKFTCPPWASLRSSAGTSLREEAMVGLLRQGWKHWLSCYCQPDTLCSHGEREPQLKVLGNCFPQTGLWPYLWEIVFMTNDAGSPAHWGLLCLGSESSYVRKAAEQESGAH